MASLGEPLAKQDARSRAILMYGPLRTFEQTAPSMKRRLASGEFTSIFYFGPSNTDNPGSDYTGRLNAFGTFKSNPKSDVSSTQPANGEALQHAYGSQLKGYKFHNKPTEAFVTEAESTIRRDQWLMQLNPYRMFSMVFNIEGVVKLMLEYEEQNGHRFDEIIITRPDLAFYSEISSEVADGEIHVPQGEGLNVVGAPHRGNARVFFYKNVLTGDLVPGGGEITFNDQLFWIKRSGIDAFLTLSEALPNYLREGVPPSPETIFYLHLIGRAGMRLFEHPEWTYEIHRASAPLKRSLVDTPEINVVDRRHPAAVAFRRRRPVYSMLRDARWLGRKAFRTFFRR